MDRMEALLKDKQPIDVILLFAAEENDSSKIGEKEDKSSMVKFQNALLKI